MSKEKPEVGDVWGHKATCDAVKIYIKENSYAERGQDVYKVLRDDINSSIVGWTFQYLPEKTIKKYYTYLGKSKANLNDLFKVKDEL